MGGGGEEEEEEGDVSSSYDQEVHSTSTSRSIINLTKLVTCIETKCRAKIHNRAIYTGENKTRLK